MKLYEIDLALEELLDQVDPETGELTCDLEALEALTMEREKKLEGIALYIKGLTAEAEAIKAEKQTLEKRQKSAENHAIRLRQFLAQHVYEDERIKTPRVAISWRHSEGVEIQPGFMEWAKQNADYLLKYEDPKPRLTEIKEALKAGQDVPCACIATRQNLQIR